MIFLDLLVSLVHFVAGHVWLAPCIFQCKMRAVLEVPVRVRVRVRSRVLGWGYGWVFGLGLGLGFWVRVRVTPNSILSRTYLIGFWVRVRVRVKVRVLGQG